MTALCVVGTAAELAAVHASRSVFFVPTMGALHVGHLALVHHARRLADAADGIVCVSIFVNPLQFGPTEDLAVYPRTLDADLAALDQLADTCFVPSSTAEIYPEGQEIFIHAPELGAQLCGASRPGFFSGVLTVINKLFALVRPHTAVFGRKDFQQLVLIRKMVRQLHLPVLIDDCATIREADGLACSSRNSLLEPAKRPQAVVLYAALQTAATAIAQQTAAVTACAAASQLLSEAGFEVDYVECRTKDNLLPWPSTAAKKFVVLGAAKLGSVRLIDNVADAVT